MLRLARSLLALTTGAALIGGCGGQSPDANRAAQTLTRAYHALALGDGATLCSLSTATGQAILEAAIPHTSCAQVVRVVSAHLTAKQRAAAASVRIARVTVKGRVASVAAADISSAHGTFKGFLIKGSTPARLTKQGDGSWKISG